ncbi:MAG: amino acid--tRNA ligase-related protein, partial [Candidatus Bathyarchaeia archaeon]
VMKLLEEIMHFTCTTVKENCRKELEILKHEVEVPKLPLKRLTYSEVLEELKTEGNSVPWGEDIPTPAYRTLGKLHPYFYFVTDWPTESKPFYIAPKDDQPEVSEGFDLMWRWMELASGGTRVHVKSVLMHRLKEQGLNPESFRHHLQVFDYGVPPHAGWATGLERMVMMLTGKRNIREVVLFPRDRSRLTP